MHGTALEGMLHKLVDKISIQTFFPPKSYHPLSGVSKCKWDSPKFRLGVI